MMKKLKGKLYWNFKKAVGSSMILSKLFLQYVIHKEMDKTGFTWLPCSNHKVFDKIVHGAFEVGFRLKKNEDGSLPLICSSLWLKKDDAPFFICSVGNDDIGFLTPEYFLEESERQKAERVNDDASMFIMTGFVPKISDSLLKAIKEYAENKNKRSEIVGF